MRKLTLIVCAVMVLAVLVLFPAKVNAAVVNSGTYGGNLTWSLDDEGTLVISGVGAMADYQWNAERPWDVNLVTSVVIEEGVTNIGNDVFREHPNLSSVTIPSSVTYIGSGAFYHCNRLIHISIPGSVHTIKSGAFNWCENLASVNMAYGVISIEEYAFFDTSLTEVILPDSVISIGQRSFAYNSNLKTVVLSQQLTNIDSEAFLYSKLISITIPESVTNLSGSAFSGCSELTGIWVEEGNKYYTSDDCGVLFNADKTELILAPIRITGSYDIPTGVQSISSAFAGCKDLTDVNIPVGVTKLGMFAFEDCDGLSYIVLPDGFLSTSWATFAGCSNMTAVLLPESTSKIDELSFSGCSNLNTVFYKGTEIQRDNITVYDGNSSILNATWHYECISIERGKSTYIYCPDCDTYYLPDGTEYAVSPEYYLVGHINGADYGCESDYENQGDYKFVDDTLVATFTKDSYVFIKTGDNLKWYMSSTYVTDTTATLYNTQTGTTEKMFVPGGVELTFTLLENEDGSLTLSYEPAESGYTLSGTITSFGNDTDAAVVELIQDGTVMYSATCTDNAYTITNVTPGKYTLRVSKPNHAALETELTVETADIITDTTICLVGDTNGDGKLNMKDWSRLYNHISEISELTDYALQCADVTGDGKVNMKDWSRLYNHISEVNPLW